MALRWRHTPSVTLEHDWQLSCGGWQVGRRHEELRAVGHRTVFGWSLTGPYIPPQAPLRRRGEGPTVAAAKLQLVDAFRTWAIWAGLRQPDGGRPVQGQSSSGR